MRKKVFYFIVFTVLSSLNLFADEENVVLGKNGHNLFNLTFLNKGEKLTDNDSGESVESTYTLNKDEKRSILGALGYWKDVLNTDNSLFSKMYVYTSEDKNALSYNDIRTDEEGKGMTDFQAKLLGETISVADDYPVTVIEIGKLNFKTGAPSSISNVGGTDLFGVVVHELGHSLGIHGTANYDEETGEVKFKDVLSKFDEGFIDSNGKKISETGKNIYFIDEDGNEIGNKDTDFDASTSVYFVGNNVSEVLKDSSLVGVPVNIELEGEVLIPELSHLELKRGLMSHQSYRNYTTFMEGELALLQDIGYDIDRKNFFGYSVYGDNLNIENKNGYFLRDEAGKKYIVGKPNLSSYGIGLHVYGSNNTIVQKADLLTTGVAGTGIRVDGIKNKITVDKGIKVNADGEYGTGILVAYGKEHTIINNGDISARGKDGVGVRFDFGSGASGDKKVYLGSYTLFNKEVDYSNDLENIYDSSMVADDINGALVENFNTSGHIEGKYSSLYMSKNAYVKNINVSNGATLKGDIISMYSPKKTFNNEALETETNLNLGVNKDDITKADSNFKFRFDDNIKGKNIALNIKGGNSSLNGKNEILRGQVDSGAILSGNGQYLLAKGESFINKGTISPGNSIGKISIQGNYKQEDEGRVNVEFDGSGAHDTLEIVGDASFAPNTELKLIPLKSYYSDSFQIKNEDMLKITGIKTGEIGKFILEDKEFFTFKFNVDPKSNNLTVVRNKNAYTDLAEDKNTKDFAKAIDNISGAASGPIQNLIEELDFSSPKTVSSTLSQLSPNIYGGNIIATFDSAKEYSALIRNHIITEKNYEKNELYSFGNLFYKDSNQRGTSHLAGYDYTDQGVIAGIEKLYTNNLMLGTHLVYSQSNLEGEASNKSEITSKNILLGVHGKYYLNQEKHDYLYGIIRGGIQENELKNKVSFGNYRNNTDSDWQALSMSNVIGYGRDISYESFTLTPLVELGYSVLRPEESKDDNLGITVDSKTYQSVYSKVGGKLSSKPISIGEKTKVAGNLIMSYNYDFIDDYDINGSIAQNKNSNFKIKTKNPDNNYMNIQGGVTFTVKEDLDVTLDVGTDLFREKYDSINTSLSFEWKF